MGRVKVLGFRVREVDKAPVQDDLKVEVELSGHRKQDGLVALPPPSAHGRGQSVRGAGAHKALKPACRGAVEADHLKWDVRWI